MYNNLQLLFKAFTDNFRRDSCGTVEQEKIAIHLIKDIDLILVPFNDSS